MTLKSALAPRVVALSIGVALLLTGAVTQANEETVTLNGYIEVAEYDDDENVASVSIYDSEWGSVLISNEGRGSELRKHVDADVELTGQIVELDDDSGYSYAIKVTSFKVEKSEEPEDDQEDPENEE
jgi:hypothetical protein